jgi:DNA helicase II / ATP-dependent DNA helicase PcrA
MPLTDRPWEQDDEEATPTKSAPGDAPREDPRLVAILDGLTEPQRESVKHTEGALLILAAAGSGKTRVVTRRIAWLIAHGVPSWSILALTFTNKAAGEMKHRAESLLAELGLSARGLTVTTFHAMCARLLRKYAAEVPPRGLPSDFTIFDADDQQAAVKKALAHLELSSTNWPPRSVQAAISNAKNDLLGPDEFAARAKDFHAKNIARAYSAYEQILRGAGAVDFDDLLVLTSRLLREKPEVRRQCAERWQYLMIDEYQDTNRAQFTIASLLAGVVPGEASLAPHPSAGPTPSPLRGEGGRQSNVCVVGDPDQAIYGWRGADIRNILEFEDQFQGCRVIKLGENFRSTTPILGAADALIKHNKKRKDKPLFTTRAGGEPVEMVLCREEQHEARLVTDWFQRLASGDDAAGVERPLAWRDMAVFYRTNAFSRVIEDGLRRAQIPYVIARGTSFFQREEVKNAVAYLRLIANQADDVSLARIVNVPPRGIGDSAQSAVEDLAQARGVTMLSLMRSPMPLEGVASRSWSAIGKFVELIDDWTGGGSFMGQSLESGSLRELVARVIRESGLEKHYKERAAKSGLEADGERLDNLDELISSASEFELEYDATADPFSPTPEAGSSSPVPTPPLLALLRAYLESIALVSDADKVDPELGAVTLMTLHASKGLEFQAVAMIGLEEGSLPHQRANESEASLEEERRLCFVGITRAMRRLLMTSARYRTNRGIPERTVPSRFLGELPKACVRVSDQAGEEWGGRDRVGGEHGGGPRYEAGDFDQREPAPFPVGSRVRHPQFGVGQVVSVTAGLNARAQINFEQAGTKTLLLQYARLTPEGK